MAVSKTTAKTTAKKAAAPAKAAKAPAAKPAPATKAAPAKAPAASKAAKPKKSEAAAAPKQGKPAVPTERRRNYVEVAAYFIAERHGFTPGRELQDWAAAEAEIDRLLEAGLLHP